MLYFGYLPDVIAARCAHLMPVEMRMEMNEGTGNCLLINDSYSLDLNSLTIALDYLAHQLQPITRICVAADLTLPTQYIRARLARQWLFDPPTLNKRPAIFLLYK